ncbi:hypothetical protein Y032_0033g2765 [Ancylostoma ceylanicum]|uniref:Phosphoglycerate mutase family protein n=1 Tax=Ancylostoma ceylanicum TaxID=53326 RepID=A0A016UP65_9BILA|nr:hypothetical protein Y032_0033g2765 [Ancylostoma ceylanicum]
MYVEAEAGDTCPADNICGGKMSYPRTIWVVRHAEREDNINRKWRSLPGGSELASDNSMLSERGRTQAKECAVRGADMEEDKRRGNKHVLINRTIPRANSERPVLAELPFLNS